MEVTLLNETIMHYEILICNLSRSTFYLFHNNVSKCAIEPFIRIAWLNN